MNRSLLAGTARHGRRTRYGRSMAYPCYPVSVLKERSDLTAGLETAARRGRPAQRRDGFLIARLPFGQIECASVSSRYASFCSWVRPVRTGAAPPAAREPSGGSQAPTARDSGGRHGQRPSHGLCQIQENAALRRCRRRHRHGRRPRCRRDDDRRERGVAHRSRRSGQHGRQLVLRAGNRDADQAPRCHLPGKHIVRSLFRYLPARRQHQRPAFHGIARDAAGERASDQGPRRRNPAHEQSQRRQPNPLQPHERQRSAHLRPGPQLHRRAAGLQRREDEQVHLDRRHRQRHEPDRPAVPGLGTYSTTTTATPSRDCGTTRSISP